MFGIKVVYPKEYGKVFLPGRTLKQRVRSTGFLLLEVFLFALMVTCWVIFFLGVMSTYVSLME